MAELRDRWLATAELEKVVDNPDRSDWLPVGKFLHEATAGKPAQNVDLTSQGEKIATQTIVIGDKTIAF